MILAPYASKHTLECVHIRQSGADLQHYRSWGTDLERLSPQVMDSGNRCILDSASGYQKYVSESLAEFANWAFGPRGIRSLQLIAFGDFSCLGRYKDDTVLLERVSGPTTPGNQGDLCFQAMGTDVKPLLGLLDKYKDAIEACPADSLLNVVED